MSYEEALKASITATEKRIADYKKLVQDSYKVGDKDLVELIKPIQKDEEKWLSYLRTRKTELNQSIYDNSFPPSWKL